MAGEWLGALREGLTLFEACGGGAGSVSRAERGALREKIGAMLLQYVRAELDTPAAAAAAPAAPAAPASAAATAAAPPAAGATSTLQRVGAVAIDVCASVGTARSNPNPNPNPNPLPRTPYPYPYPYP